jgi:hypothetical protein
MRASLVRAQEQNDSLDLFDAFGIRKAKTVLKVKPENLGTVEHQTKKAQKSHPQGFKKLYLTKVIPYKNIRL